MADAPTHIAYNVREGKENDTSFWDKVGVAWEHKDGNGLNIVLNSTPINGKITIRKVDGSEKAE